MRSNVCNNYFCPSLQEYFRERRAGQSARAFVVAANGEDIRAAAFVEPEFTREAAMTHVADDVPELLNQ